MVKTQLPVTIDGLLMEAAAEYGASTAFTDGVHTLSFNQVEQLSKRVAKHFWKMGMRKGDVIAVQLPNSMEFVLAHLAAAQIGLVFNPLSPNYRRQELTYMLGHCETKAIIVQGSTSKFNFEALAYEVKEKLPHLSHVITAGGAEHTESILFSTFLEDDPEGVADKDLFEEKPGLDDPSLIMFTSGTESNPKAVLHTSRTFVATHLRNGYEYQVSEQDTILSLTPLCHMFSLPMIMIGLHQGAKHYLYGEYRVEELIDIFRHELVTFLIAAPAHLLDVLHYIKAAGAAADGVKLRLVLTGGTKIPSQMVKDLRDVLHCNVGAQWGMTEVCAGSFTRPEDDPSKAWESIGRVCPTGEVIIVDEENNVLPHNEIGEIAFKGDSLFVEYYRNPDATRMAFNENGYFLTGDQGYLDEGGYIYFSGRSKDTINRGGLKFHASEIEEALLMNPKVRQAAVVSVPDPRLGERACAYISLRDGEEWSFEEVKSFLLEQGFAKYKIPEYVEMRKELPATPSGKIVKGPLRTEAQLLGKE
ncbi:class I adenylate-forming enzyme family protein [Domibacillus epiphyticus]|uniref:AMP-dependent synthetase n=1 Tax=Domibacillus epiphyticus TaxID=1714355 RepID=A0A1V2A4S6_9BACI|nr:AMP-binding protein [Domibacillus epiphyticus]OMP66009.1 hypothetical protein BTO28_14560 [Domibacillus epiphyticus]